MLTTRGVLYIKWGTEVDAVLQRSIQSLKKFHPELPHHIVSLDEGATLLEKARMLDFSPFEQTLFLDTDTVVMDRLDFGFEKAMKFGISCCVCECPWARRYGGLQGDIIEYNTGVIFFTKQAKPLFDLWARHSPTLDSSIHFRRGADPTIHTMALNDQGPFALAVELSGINPHILPLNWNFRPAWQHVVGGPVKIWHDYGNPPPELEAWSRSQCNGQKIIEFRSCNDKKGIGMRSSLIILLGCLYGCASVPNLIGNSTDEKAKMVLQQSAVAEGADALMRLHDVQVGFDGYFSWIVPKVQPVLVDSKFRGSSEEDYLVHSMEVVQTHHGTGGTKIVQRKPGEVLVSYNGKQSDDPDVKDAAALVADDYRMFLLGPKFFIERGAVVQYLGTECVDGFDCDQLLAMLSPGLGNSKADRVVISIDRQQHWIRRLRVTVEGMNSTKGAVADIFLRDPIRIGGVVFPTRFYEELKRPFDAPVHHWRLTEISLH